MGTEIKVWEIDGNELKPVVNDSLAGGAHLEAELETWIVKNLSY